MAFSNKRITKLPPNVSRILMVTNLPYELRDDEMYDIFGKYGTIRQIRVGNVAENKGKAFVVYEDIYDAQNACEHLTGFNVCNRYICISYYQPTKVYKKVDYTKKNEELNNMKMKFGLSTPRNANVK